MKTGLMAVLVSVALAGCGDDEGMDNGSLSGTAGATTGSSGMTASASQTDSSGQSGTDSQSGTGSDSGGTTTMEEEEAESEEPSEGSGGNPCHDLDMKECDMTPGCAWNANAERCNPDEGGEESEGDGTTSTGGDVTTTGR